MTAPARSAWDPAIPANTATRRARVRRAAATVTKPGPVLREDYIVFEEADGLARGHLIVDPTDPPDPDGLDLRSSNGGVLLDGDEVRRLHRFLGAWIDQVDGVIA
ncbi:MAG: hypothetical protein M0P31_19220 [Solirubrobacteraceae bacterium]|nr:hypothetical protein [Solirubrobacteraceae bacterium]